MFRASLQIWSLKPPSSRAATARLSLFDAMRRCDPKERSKAYKAQKQFMLKHSDASGKHLKAPKKLVAHHDTPSECIEIWVWNRSHIAHARPPSFDRHHLISTVLSFLLTLLAADRVAWKLYIVVYAMLCWILFWRRCPEESAPLDEVLRGRLALISCDILCSRLVRNLIWYVLVTLVFWV